MLQFRSACAIRHSPSLHSRYGLRCPSIKQHTRPHAVAASGAATDAITDGLILSHGKAGSWDEVGVGSPVVRCFIGDNEQRWFMWYTGRGAEAPSLDGVTPSSGSIGVAYSNNGVEWQRGSTFIEGARGEAASQDVGAVLEPNKDWWTFDTCHMQVSDVQILSNSSVNSGVGVFWMFYSGGDFEALAAPPNMPFSLKGTPCEGLRMRPGLAMSQDGRNWARIEGDHHTGALFDVGGEGEWDELFIGAPQVVAAGPRDMRMYYHSWDARRGRYVVGLATSPDGFRWSKQGVVFDPAASSAAGSGAHDALGATFRHVVRDVDNKQFLMFYEAVAADGSSSIGLAVSKDGRRDWRRCPTPVLSASSSPGAWDQGGVGAPCAVAMSAGKWRLYYAAKQRPGEGPWTGIGLALSVDGGSTFEGAPSQYKRRTGPAGK